MNKVKISRFKLWLEKCAGWSDMTGWKRLASHGQWIRGHVRDQTLTHKKCNVSFGQDIWDANLCWDDDWQRFNVTIWTKVTGESNAQTDEQRTWGKAWSVKGWMLEREATPTRRVGSERVMKATEGGELETVFLSWTHLVKNIFWTWDLLRTARALTSDAPEMTYVRYLPPEKTRVQIGEMRKTTSGGITTEKQILNVKK